jgi:putative oxidoreductase
MKNTDLGLLLLRVGTGTALLLGHGWGKFLRLIEGNLAFADPLGIGAAPTFLFAVFAEFLCALAIVLGLRTRWAAIAPLITMLVAALLHHAGDPFGDREKAVLYAVAFAALLFTGGGRYAVDRWLSKKR